MTQKSDPSTAALWARFRFSVVGSLLSAPPAPGELKTALQSLAAKTWTHPVNGNEVHFAIATIERWYYTARREKDDPVRVLRRAVRKDCGKVSLAAEQIQHLLKQYEDHKQWTYQLHYDNLAAAVKAKPAMGPLRSYCTVRRYMQAHGLLRQPRVRPKGRPGEVVAAERRENREVRSYEAEYVGSLWHLDFHHGSLKVLTSRGQWQRPIALAILDDHSRLCCHLQWYLSETAEDLVHGLSQAIQKRGLPRALLTDNGAAMVAEEVGEGLLRLGIVHEKTLPYSPYQNGKQEVFWATLEGRLMEMLDGCAEAFAGLPQRSQPGLGGDRLPPRGASRDRLLPAGTFRRGPGRAPHESHQQRPPRRLPPGKQAPPAQERRHDLGGGRAFRGPGPLPPLPGRLRALRPLGPRPGRSGRSPQRHRPGPLVSAGPHGQRRCPPAASSGRLRNEAPADSGDGSRQAVAAAVEEDPRRVFRHGTAAGLPAQESPCPRKESAS